MSKKWGHGLILPVAECFCAVAQRGFATGKLEGHRVGKVIFSMVRAWACFSVSGEECDEQACLTLRENEHRKHQQGAGWLQITKKGWTQWGEEGQALVMWVRKSSSLGVCSFSNKVANAIFWEWQGREEVWLWGLKREEWLKQMVGGSEQRAD